MPRLMILFLGLGMVSAPGLAGPDWVEGKATFERPVRSDRAILDGESAWYCEGATCRGRAPDRLQSARRYCRQLARWGGTITSFQAGPLIFDAADLRACNGGR